MLRNSAASIKAAAVAGLLVLSGAACALSYGKTWELEVNFRTGQSSLPAAERERLSKLLAKMTSDAVCVERVIVLAYTNTKEGSGERANELSQRRADFVATLLRSSRVPPESVYAEGRGPRPLWACASSADKACASLEFVTKLKGAPSCP